MRATLIILDGVGAGAMPDAADWGDAEADTLGHVAEFLGGLRVPNLQALGLGCIRPVAGVPCVESPRAAHGRMAIASDGKDTITGHWELMGCPVPERFAMFPEGFPDDIIGPFERAIGRRVLGNKPASGTVIIEELGAEHMRTGRPIVYTSADSVFQIAAHEDVVPVEQLYAWCRIAFDIVAPRRVARVIARPFVGEPGNFQRTYGRKDFALLPPERTVLDALVEAGLPVAGVGKIPAIFGGRGFTEKIHAGANDEVVAETLAAMDRLDTGFVFANLVDFDSRYGHRRNPEGYGRALERFDEAVPELVARTRPGDLLLITADHGCDPTWVGTDHTREYVPLLAWTPGGRGVDLGLRQTLSDVAASLADWFDLPWSGPGRSFVPELRG